MTHGGAGSRRIHIRVEGDQARDLGALHRWLSREDWFRQAQAEYGLKIAYREENGTERDARPDGPPMGGLITELVLVVAGAALAPAFEDLYTRAKAAVCAWAGNSGVDAPQVDTGPPQVGTGPPQTDAGPTGADTPQDGRDEGPDTGRDGGEAGGAR